MDHTETLLRLPFGQYNDVQITIVTLRSFNQYLPLSFRPCPFDSHARNMCAYRIESQARINQPGGGKGGGGDGICYRSFCPGN